MFMNVFLWSMFVSCQCINAILIPWYQIRYLKNPLQFQSRCINKKALSDGFIRLTIDVYTNCSNNTDDWNLLSELKHNFLEKKNTKRNECGTCQSNLWTVHFYRAVKKCSLCILHATWPSTSAFAPVEFRGQSDEENNWLLKTYLSS